MSHWIDISVPLQDGMVHWPGDPEIRISRAASMAAGDSCNVTHLDMGAHTGTHMDAPLHFIQEGAGIDLLPIDAVVGPCRIVAIENAQYITADELRALNLQPGERVLFKTRNSEMDWSEGMPFQEDFVHIRADAAHYLAECKIQTVGVDYLSVGGYERDGTETHQALLGAGIWIIEGLLLAGVEPGNYELLCLPLRIVGSDGAPARAVVRKV